MASIPAVQSSHIKHGMLIDIQVNDVVYRLSNLYTAVTYNGNSYTQLGHFLNIGEIQDDLRATNNQISITLSGIPPSDPGDLNYMGIALNSKIKGSKINLYRAFFDTSSGYYVPTQVYLRFSGYISNYSLTENWDQTNQLVSNNIGIQCSSINAIMEKQYTGRRTNQQDQQRFYPGDTGMYRVKSLADTQFDFGKPYTAPSSGGGGGGGTVDYSAP